MLTELLDAGLPVESVNRETAEFSRRLTPDEARTYRAILARRRQPTPRQLEFIRMAARGLANKEIAARACVTKQTVKNTLSDLYERIGVHDRAHAVYMLMGQ